MRRARTCRPRTGRRSGSRTPRARRGDRAGCANPRTAGTPRAAGRNAQSTASAFAPPLACVARAAVRISRRRWKTTMRTAWITNAAIAVGNAQRDLQWFQMNAVFGVEPLDQQHRAEREEHILAEE